MHARRNTYLQSTACEAAGAHRYFCLAVVTQYRKAQTPCYTYSFQHPTCRLTEVSLDRSPTVRQVSCRKGDGLLCSASPTTNLTPTSLFASGRHHKAFQSPFRPGGKTVTNFFQPARCRSFHVGRGQDVPSVEPDVGARERSAVLLVLVAMLLREWCIRDYYICSTRLSW